MRHVHVWFAFDTGGCIMGQTDFDVSCVFFVF